MSEYPRRERYDDRDRGRYSRGTGNYRDATFDRRQGPKEPYQDRERGEFRDDRTRGYRPDDRGGQVRSWDSADSRKHSPSRDGKRADDVLEAGNPNSQIIFRGLEKDITESDLQQYLLNQGAAIESVIVIRDRETRESRGFAFVKFLAVEAAQHYMEQHHPVVEIGASRVKIAYSLGRGEEDNGWNCDKCGLVNFPRRESCYRCGFPRQDMAPKSPPKSMTQKAWIMNDGTSDIGETPAQFLLIRNLDTMLQEENIAKGLMKLESEPKRILLIRDRKTKVSWGYAFVEYRDVSLAQAALEKYKGYKSFKIERSRAKISYCHPGVFVPVYSDEGNFSFKTANGATVAYWDEYGYASEWVQPSKEVAQDEQLTQFYTDLKASEALHATAATIISEPVMHPDADKKRELWGQIDQQKKKRKIESIAVSKTPAAQLEKWASKRQELNEDKPRSSSPPTENKKVSEFADLKQMCCLLCKRKFQSIAEIQKHERMSNLHKSNLADDVIRNTCLAKIRDIQSEETASTYRDRARERRIQFHQPHRPELAHPNPRIAAKHVLKQASPEPERANKGAQLLAAMGWTKGSGLGAEGTGIVEPIRAESYAAGVGLGAGNVKVVGEDIGGKEDDGSYRAYVRKVRDVARERYEEVKEVEE